MREFNIDFINLSVSEFNFNGLINCIQQMPFLKILSAMNCALGKD